MARPIAILVLAFVMAGARAAYAQDNSDIDEARRKIVDTIREVREQAGDTSGPVTEAPEREAGENSESPAARRQRWSSAAAEIKRDMARDDDTADEPDAEPIRLRETGWSLVCPAGWKVDFLTVPGRIATICKTKPGSSPSLEVTTSGLFGQPKEAVEQSVTASLDAYAANRSEVQVIDKEWVTVGSHEVFRMLFQAPFADQPGGRRYWVWAVPDGKVMLKVVFSDLDRRFDARRELFETCGNSLAKE